MPCLKLVSNAQRAHRMSNDVDIDCSVLLDGVPLEAAGRSIVYRLLETASGGRLAKSESPGFGNHQFVPWVLGAWF